MRADTRRHQVAIVNNDIGEEHVVVERNRDICDEGLEPMVGRLLTRLTVCALLA